MMMVEPERCPESDKSTQCHLTCETSDKCVSRCAAYGHVCPCDARAAGRSAKLKMDTILESSKLFQDGPPMFRTVDESEIVMGDKLGEGGFAIVSACSLEEAPLDESLAIKCLKRRIMVERKLFEHGAGDMATEAFFLARLDHPNIVKLHAVTKGSVESNVSSGRDGGFFIVIDRLVETLEQRVARWKDRADQLPDGMFYRMSNQYKEAQRTMLKERVEVALEIAKVMEYLHKRDIVYRDLKPDNVGFDGKGALKLFDFGLAKELKDKDKVDDDKYRMTGHTGSRRYMAPEIGRDLPYNKSVDVYSFGIMLWEMCSLEKPFAGYCAKKHIKAVEIGGERPKMDHSHTTHWPMNLQWLMNSSWSEPDNRPTFTVIRETLEGTLEELNAPKADRVRAVTEGNHDHPEGGHRAETRLSWKGKSPRAWRMGRLRSNS